MILRRALYKEVTLTSLAVALILFALFAFLGLSRFLGKAAVGEQAADVVLTLLSLELLRRVDLLLPLAFFIGILMTMGRWYRDNEMTVLAACGVGVASLLRPLAVLALGCAVTVSVFSLYLSPLAIAASERVKAASANRPEIGGIVPRAFTELQGSGNRRVVYVEDIGDDGVMHHVFVSAQAGERRDVLTATSGYQYIDKKGDRFLILKNGARYRGAPGAGDYSMLDFGAYAFRVKASGAVTPEASIGGMPSTALLSATGLREQAEWHWRLAKPMSVFVLATFALVLAYTDVRRGRIANLFIAILVYFIYSNLLGIGNTLLAAGRTPAVLGLWWVHAALATVAAYSLLRRNQNRPLLALPRLAGYR